jgi:hypothetical protein
MSRPAADSRAPLYTVAFDLAGWLLGHLNNRPDTLSCETCRLVLRLLDCIVLALKDRERLDNLDAADMILLQLRQRLRLAAGQAIFDQRQALYALGLCDDLGRQIGGWLKTLDGAE